MKKSILTLVLAIASISIFAAPVNKSENVEFVLTDNGITFVNNLRHGINNNLVAVNNSGEKLVFNMEDVKKFRKDGKEFHRRYVVEEGSQVVRKVFMQLIYTRAGHSFYKRSNKTDDNLGLKNFFVYKNETQEYQLNENNYKSILSFFFPRYNLLYS